MQDFKITALRKAKTTMLLIIVLSTVLLKGLHSAHCPDVEVGKFHTKFYNNNCYIFSFERKKFQDAYNFCRELGIHLTDIDDETSKFFQSLDDENDFNVSKNFWIGLFWTSALDDPVWDSGRRYSLVFDTYEIKNSSRALGNCARYRPRTVRWTWANCSSTENFICSTAEVPVQHALHSIVYASVAFNVMLGILVCWFFMKKRRMGSKKQEATPSLGIINMDPIPRSQPLIVTTAKNIARRRPYKALPDLSIGNETEEMQYTDIDELQNEMIELSVKSLCDTGMVAQAKVGCDGPRESASQLQNGSNLHSSYNRLRMKNGQLTIVDSVYGGNSTSSVVDNVHGTNSASRLSDNVYGTNSASNLKDNVYGTNSASRLSDNVYDTNITTNLVDNFYDTNSTTNLVDNV